MFNLRFRSKLILAMTLVVVSVTAVMLWVTQNRIQEAYTAVFSDQFQNQLELVTKRQQQRLGDLGDICEVVAKSPNFINAFTSEDPGSAPKAAELEIYKLATAQTPQLETKHNLLQALLSDDPFALGVSGGTGVTGGSAPKPQKPQTQNTQQNAAPRPGVRRLLNQEISVIVLDANGTEILRSEGPRAGNKPPKDLRMPDVKFTEESIVRLMRSKRTDRPDEQKTGFTVIGGKDLKEIVITPIRSRGGSEEEAPMGALLVALSFSSMEDFSQAVFGETTDPGSMRSGLWLRGKIFSKGMPAEMAGILARKIDDERKSPSTADGVLSMNLNGEPYRAIYRELDPESPIPGMPAYQVGIFSMAEAEAEQTRLFRLILASGSFALAGALIAILFLSRGLSQPILRLLQGTNEIRDGNFNHRVKVSGKDELGQLSTAFNEMAQDLALNQKYHTVLTQVADKGIARALMRGEVTLGGELRKVSVLFCDIRGFTSLTEGMPPQDVVQLLNEHMTAMTELVHAHQGVVDKFVGDLIMAIFGAPVAYEDDAGNAARCALAMMAARAQLNQSSPYRFEVGIGIATGESLVGCMGSINRLDYTVLGERVNLASRLCGVAAPQEVLVDETTVNELGARARTEAVGELDLKGFTGTSQAWRLLQAPTPPPSQPTPKIGTVGRKD